MGFELPPKQLWLPARPAIIRPATKELLPAPVMGLTMLARMAMLRTARHQAAFALTSVGAGTAITAGVGQITQSADIPVGSTVVALAVTNSPTKIVTSIEDDHGGYTQVNSTVTAAGISVSMWYTFNSLGMSGSAFFGNFSSPPTAWAFSAFAISGATATDPLDASTTGATAAGTTVSATLSTAFAKTLLVAAVGSSGTSGSLTQPGFVTPFDVTGSNFPFAGGGNKQLSSAGSNTYSGTVIDNGNMGLVLASFKLN